MKDVAGGSCTKEVAGDGPVCAVCGEQKRWRRRRVWAIGKETGDWIRGGKKKRERKRKEERKRKKRKKEEKKKKKVI